MAQHITQERLKHLLHYDTETGVFTRRVDVGKSAKKGSVVGCPNDKGYLRVVLDGRLYALHRLAVLYVDGVVHDGDVDHANGNKADNRWANLRACTRSQNAANRKVQINNSCGMKGASRDRNGRWRSQISTQGKKVFLGLFDTPEDAHAAYMSAAQKYHGEYARA